jgi:hypothetical protein
MLYCPKCKVHINGYKKACPLCGSQLEGEKSRVEEAYPQIQTENPRHIFLIRILSFLAIVACFVCLAINVLFPTRVFWAFIAICGIACGYVTLTVGILTRRNFLHNITRQLFLITALAFVWDFFTGRHGWSLDYVWPCCCSVVLLMMLISLRFFNNKYAYYAFNVIIVCVYGLIPFIALCLHKVQVGWPALVSGIMSLVTLAAYIIFDTKNTKNQMSRKFHL